MSGQSAASIMRASAMMFVIGMRTTSAFHATQPAKLAHEELVFVPNAIRLG
jgi:hypothetical protein